MRALTVQQPWAWAIVHGGKDVENRTQAWSYRGPLAIHAGVRISQRGLDSDLVTDAWQQAYGWDIRDGAYFTTGAIIGVVDLVDAHRAEAGCNHDDPCRELACCDSPWAELSYAGDGGKTRRDVVHLVLENPRPLPSPIPCRGALGLWTPPAEVLDQLHEVAA